jgi:hypothetical protein
MHSSQTCPLDVDVFLANKILQKQLSILLANKNLKKTTWLYFWLNIISKSTCFFNTFGHLHPANEKAKLKRLPNLKVNLNF